MTSYAPRALHPASCIPPPVPRLFTIQTILLAFLALGLVVSLVTPIFEGPDEMAHFAYVKALADGRGFPGQPIVIADDAPAQESGQPPLYYLTAALAVKVLAPDTADFSSLLRRNLAFPVVSAETPNDNKNVFVPVDPQPFPYRGATRAIHVARLVAVLFGAVAVYGAYRLAGEVFPGRRALALGAGLVTAGLPQFVFTSSMVSNDSTLAALCTLGLWLIVRLLRRGPTWRQALTLGVVLGLAGLSKTTGLGLAGVAAAALVVYAFALRPGFPPEARGNDDAAALVVEPADVPLRRIAASLAVMLVVCALIIGPWYARMQIVFDDALGVKPHLLMPWARTPAASFGESFSELPQMVTSFWLAFGWGVIVMPDWAYTLLDGAALIGLTGALGYVFGRRTRLERGLIGLLFAWLLIIAAALISWNRLFHAALGRLAFPALAALSVLMLIGWRTWAARLFGSRRADRLAALPALGLFGLAVLSVPLWLAPAFSIPPRLSQAQIEQQPGRPIDIRYGDVARLIRLDVPRGDWPQPGERWTVRVCWETLAKDDRPLMIFVQFVGAQNRIVGVRRSYPGLGQYPTRLWQPGVRFCDNLRVQVGPDTPAPAVYQVEVGMFDADTLERLPAYLPDGARLSSNFVDRVKVAPGAYPSPTIENSSRVYFGDQLELIGYALDADHAPPGGRVTVTLTWRAMRRPEADYTVFVHLLDAAGNSVAQADSQPQAGAYPTSFWDAAEVVGDVHVIELPATLAPGDYEIEIGWYVLNTGARLPVEGDPGGALRLSRVRIEGRR